MAEVVDPANYDMYSMGFSSGGHLRNETYPEDQISIKRHGSACRDDNATTTYEIYDGIARHMPSIFAEHRLRSVSAPISTR
eukprot:2156698-Amphidinium_carterae.4